MKRSGPIRRKTPLRRSAFRRKPVAEYPSAAQLREREAWAEQFNRCWICFCTARNVSVTGPGLETHEIASRAQAPNRWAEKCNYFRSCPTCHREVLSWICEALQLAYKRMNDPENYDRVKVNLMRGRQTNAISESEVRQWEQFLVRRAG